MFKLQETTQEREHYDHLSEYYSILVATEHLERAYIRDTIPAQDYTPACLKLIAQFKTLKELSWVDPLEFIKEYNLKVPAATKRLIEMGVPATVQHQTETELKKGAKTVAETVQIYITLMDSLKLNLLAVDQLHPQLSDLIQSLHKAQASDTVKQKVKEWLIQLNKLKASDELSLEEARQMIFDLER
jgi:ESCRT-I complex subunit VPS28